MKAWRKEAEQINKRRREVQAINATLPRRDHLAVEPTARRQMQEREQLGRMSKGLVAYSNYLLAGLMVRAGLQPAP